MTPARRRLAARAALAALVVAATWPSWRLLLLDPTSMDDVLLLSGCRSPALQILPTADGSKARSSTPPPAS